MSVKLFSQDNLSFFTHCSTHFTFIFSLQVVITRVNTWSTWLCFSSDLVIFVSVSRNLNLFSFFRKKQTKKPTTKNRPKKQKNKIIIKKTKTKTQPKQRRILLQINLFLKFYTCRSTNLLHGQFNSVKATISF